MFKYLSYTPGPNQEKPREFGISVVARTDTCPLYWP